jgi:hypothetical protein
MSAQQNMQAGDMSDMSNREMASDQQMLAGRRGGNPRPGSETKPSVRTSEFYIFLLAVGGVLLASELVGRNSAGVDIFRANTAWLLITLLSIGYLVSRGLAKAGSSWRHDREQAR